MQRQGNHAGEQRRTVAGVERLKAYGELTKPRLVLMIVLVSLASFFMAGRGSMDWPRLGVALAGIGLLAAGILALNQVLERGTDLRMRRTAGRPVPSGRLPPAAALAFGWAATAAAFALIVPLLGWVAGAVALATFVSYVLVYTPLKRRTVMHTTIGAVSGAMPPLLGWAAARGSLDRDAWILFAILFFWQYPHFLAIGAMYREDYARAGIRVLPAVDARGGGITAALVLASLLLLIGASMGPWLTGLAGDVYVVVALAGGVGFLVTGALLLARRTKRAASLVLRASVIYLPLLFAVMTMDGR